MRNTGLEWMPSRTTRFLAVHLLFTIAEQCTLKSLTLNRSPTYSMDQPKDDGRVLMSFLCFIETLCFAYRTLEWMNHQRFLENH
ncbi:hypothetical protein GLOIN_2v1578410 [Rhizophagus irregularis DAOM 181602=DAOM 197198]|nr:hypothetical protein GLOIN_2v1578410 [Rhizophagus irregularis DAOM 181602=DAOM 197198]CAB4494958.1 unnamed protein product [Rhizophagus irregularis]CAB5143794.1 unnamed protein product [Rhizophagus irregularis]